MSLAPIIGALVVGLIALVLAIYFFATRVADNARRPSSFWSSAWCCWWSEARWVGSDSARPTLAVPRRSSLRRRDRSRFAF